MDEDSIWAALGLAIAAGGFVLAFGPGLLRARRERRLLSRGVAAPARILALRDTGNRFNDAPELAIRLEVTPPTVPPFVTELRRVVGPAELGRLVPGASVAVRYDPARPGRVALAA